MIRNILYALVGFAPLVSLAHGDEVEGESELMHQVNEVLPFLHAGEGHWIAVIVLVVLWVSFFYTVYTLIKNRNSGTGGSM